MPKDDTKSTLLRNVPIDLWSRIKAQSAGELMTLQEWIIKTLEAAVTKRPANGNGKGTAHR